MSVPSQPLIGFSVTPQSISDCQGILQALLDYQCNALRLAFSGLTQYIAGNRTWNQSYVEYFLDNWDGYIVGDFQHIYPPDSATSDVYRSHLSEAQAELLSRVQPFNGNSKFLAEVVNEYDNTDFYTIADSLTAYLRNNGITNPCGANLPPHNREICAFDANLDYQGYHHYFDYTTYQGAMNWQNTMLGMGITVINTEQGASTSEANYTTQQKTDLNNYLQSCFDLGIGNMVWLNYWQNRRNLDAYETGTVVLQMPAGTTPTPECSVPADCVAKYGQAPSGYHWECINGQCVQIPDDQSPVTLPLHDGFSSLESKWQAIDGDWGVQ